MMIPEDLYQKRLYFKLKNWYNAPISKTHVGNGAILTKVYPAPCCPERPEKEGFVWRKKLPPRGAR